MADITPIHPQPATPSLADPRTILWEGQQYMDSYDYHQDYLSDGDIRKTKFQHHREFRRKIRDIESYYIYVDHKDIVILSWGQVKSGPVQDLHRLKPLFARIGHADLILLNATAQLAITHHLDNELSKQISVAINTDAARQLTGASRGALPAELAQRTMQAMLSIGQMLGTPVHIVQMLAVKQVKLDTGVDLETYLVGAPAQESVPRKEVMLEPTELAERLGMGKGNTAGAKLNKLLALCGWQRKSGKSWTLTTAGEAYGVRHPFLNKGYHGYNIKWNAEAIRTELLRQGLLARPGAAD